LAQLDHIAGLDNLNNLEVWLGGLFYPEAYITATRQAVAHRRKWSLETLYLRLDLERVNDPGSFVVDGLVLEGASWTNDRLILNDGDAVRLNSSQLRWVQIDESNQEGLVNLPVYLNNDRGDVLFTVDLPFDTASGPLVATRAVCLTAGG
jgi:dynein heavy chain 1